MHNPFKSIPFQNIDAESNLRGQTRNLSRCPSEKYNPYTEPKVEFPIPKECESKGLVPEYTRINKPCNIFSGISINRFHPLCEDVQQLNKIQSNSYAGVNTRLQVKDAFAKKNKK